MSANFHPGITNCGGTMASTGCSCASTAKSEAGELDLMVAASTPDVVYDREGFELIETSSGDFVRYGTDDYSVPVTPEQHEENEAQREADREEVRNRPQHYPFQPTVRTETPLNPADLDPLAEPRLTFPSTPRQKVEALIDLTDSDKEQEQDASAARSQGRITPRYESVPPLAGRPGQAFNDLRREGGSYRPYFGTQTKTEAGVDLTGDSGPEAPTVAGASSQFMIDEDAPRNPEKKSRLGKLFGRD